VGLGHAANDEAAQRVPDQTGAPDTGGVKERHHVGGEVLDSIAAGWTLGVAKPRWSNAKA
jgi:hypothetical protein